MSQKAFKPIFNELLDIYPGPSDAQYKAFYEEIVTRCVADVAGMLQTGGKDDKSGSTSRYYTSGEEGEFNTRAAAELGAMYRVLAKKHTAEPARNLILGNLPGFTKGMVYTPHPTEMLNESGIEAQERLMEVLIEHPKLFKTGDARQTSRLDSKERDTIHSALEELSQTMSTPVSKPLTISQEMRRSIRFSQRQFDAIPGIADTVLAAVYVDPQNPDAAVPTSSQLSMDTLKKFGHLIEPQTWSPGDQDSKPDMTADKLQEGSDLSRRAMMFHYYRTLTALGASVRGGPSPERDETLGAIQQMMHRMLKTGYGAYGKDDKPKPLDIKFADDKLRGVSEVRTNGHHAFSDRYRSYGDSSFFRSFKQDFDAKSAEAKPYASMDEFVNDLQNLRQSSVLRDKKDDKRKSITLVDSLIIQALNFDDAALRIQVRQNAERHAEVVDTILSQLPAEKMPPGTMLVQSHDQKNPRGIEKLLEAFKSKPEFRKLVQDTVSGQIKEAGDKLATFPPSPENDKAFAALSDKDKEKALQDYADKKLAFIDEVVGKDNYNMYQVMQTMSLAAKKPNQIPRYLIAECNSTTDMLEAFFLLKVTESLEEEKRKAREKETEKAEAPVNGKVEIVNLVEHPPLVKDKGQGPIAAQMTTGAMANADFREHHLSITNSNHRLKTYSLKRGDHDMTVAEAKRTYGLKVNEGDEDRTIKGVKMMMGAGSDITKAGSSAAAAAMMDTMERTREALLNNKECPILLTDYIGCGGGVHRTQPVSTSYETVQGQSMRQSPENIAQKVLGLLTEHMHKRLAMNPDSAQDKYLGRVHAPSDHKLMVQVNMSNLAQLGQNDAMWQNETRARTYAMMDKYGELYKSERFEEMMGNTADMYANLTKFAARPSNRVTSGEVKWDGFPARVDVMKTRAIGFGAALNASGICAPLYYGGSEYLKTANAQEERQLKDMYQWDPKAQDTINRMTYGVVMADMDVAWKYMGHDKAPTSAELEKMASSNPPLTVFKDKEKPTMAELNARGVEHRALAEKALAEINIEYNTVANKLLRLHQAVSGKPLSEYTDGKQAANELLGTLPTALREQLSLSREHIKKPREALANLFKDMLDGKVDPKSVKKGTDVYNTTVYPAMGALFECFEHTPRAYTRPKWVKATEPTQSRAA